MSRGGIAICKILTDPKQVLPPPPGHVAARSADTSNLMIRASCWYHYCSGSSLHNPYMYPIRFTIPLLNQLGSWGTGGDLFHNHNVSPCVPMAQQFLHPGRTSLESPSLEPGQWPCFAASSRASAASHAQPPWSQHGAPGRHCQCLSEPGGLRMP